MELLHTTKSPTTKAIIINYPPVHSILLDLLTRKQGATAPILSIIAGCYLFVKSDVNFNESLHVLKMISKDISCLCKRYVNDQSKEKVTTDNFFVILWNSRIFFTNIA